MGNIHELADAAAKRDIRLGIEIHGEITKSAEAAIPVLERIERKNVLINYDTANVEFYGGVKAVDDLPVALPKLVHCHLKDKRGEGRDLGFSGDRRRPCRFQARARHHGEGRFHRADERRDRVHGRSVAAARRGQPGDEGLARQARLARPVVGRPAMKIGILGSGFMGGTHARAYAKIPGRERRGGLVPPSRQGGEARQGSRRPRHHRRSLDHRGPVDRRDQQHAADASPRRDDDRGARRPASMSSSRSRSR